MLVPGLHTSLNDKINSKKNGGDDTLSLSLSCEASGGGPQKIGNGSERLLNLEGVTCLLYGTSGEVDSLVSSSFIWFFLTSFPRFMIP